jgi:hypothetical protein
MFQHGSTSLNILLELRAYGETTYPPRAVPLALLPLYRHCNGRGQRLRCLLEESENWPHNLQLALDDYTAAAKEGVVAVSRFTVSDEGWTALTAGIR